MSTTSRSVQGPGPARLSCLTLLWLAACAPDETTSGPSGLRLVHLRIGFESWYSDAEEFGLLADGVPVEDPGRPGRPWRWDRTETATVSVPAGTRQVTLESANKICRGGSSGLTQELPADGRPGLLRFDVICPSPLGPGVRMVWAEDAGPEQHGSRLVAALPEGGIITRLDTNLFVSELTPLGQDGFVGVGGRIEYAPDDYFGFGGWWPTSGDLIEVRSSGPPRYLTSGWWLSGLQPLPVGRYGFQAGSEMMTFAPGRDDAPVAAYLLRSGPQGIPAATWSPDGSQLALVDDASLSVVRLGIDPSPRTLRHVPAVASRAEWDPSGLAIAVLVRHGVVRSVIAVGLDGVQRWRADLNYIEPLGPPRWLPDASGVVVAGRAGADDAGLFLVRPDGTVQRLTLRRREPTAYTLWSAR